MIYLFICLISLPKVFLQPGRRNGFEFHQEDYQLDFERMELTNYNHKFVEVIEINTLKYNNSINAINLTAEYKIEIGNYLEIVTQAYKLRDGEYRRYPLDVDFNFCYALSKNYVGLSSIIGSNKCGNFTGCPILKDTRNTICNFIPDETQFPPFLPDGKYMIEFQVLYKFTELFVARGYARIYHNITDSEE